MQLENVKFDVRMLCPGLTAGGAIAQNKKPGFAGITAFLVGREKPGFFKKPGFWVRVSELRKTRLTKCPT